MQVFYYDILKQKMETFTITKTIHGTIPALPYQKLKEAVLGKNYVCSLVFAGDKRTRGLNMAYREKSYIPNTLSFALDNQSGEIFINLKQATIQSKKREESFEYYVALLFVHSCLHLKGMEHGDIMDKKMNAILRKSGIYNTYK